MQLEIELKFSKSGLSQGGIGLGVPLPSFFSPFPLFRLYLRKCEGRMELEFESGAVQWCGCSVHRADTELGREREGEPRSLPLPSTLLLTSVPPPPVGMAGGRGSVLFWDGSDGGGHLSSSPLTYPVRLSERLGRACTRLCSHISVAGGRYI